MAKARAAKVTLSEDQVLYFRACRGQLAGAGAAEVTEAARSIIGAQSQVLSPSLLALSMRTRGRPTAEQVKSAIFGQSKTLVRTWGQRDTIHVYDAASHWRQVVAAAERWSPGGRGGAMPTAAALKKALAAIDKLGNGVVTRGDLIGVVPAAYVKAIAEYAAMGDLDPKRFAAGRLLWRLAQLGDLSIAEKVGSQQGYVSRRTWFAKLDWPDLDPDLACTMLIRDYLRVYGPATPHDVAHFFGARVTNSRGWLERMNDELTPVQCGERENLVALAGDTSALRRKPPTDSKSWPLRLLPMYESMMMGHADKSWTVPVEEERKQIWRKAAIVAAVVLDRGRVVATWTQKTTSRQLKIEIQPLSAWRKTRHLAAAKREANTVAAHLELPKLQFDVKS